MFYVPRFHEDEDEDLQGSSCLVFYVPGFHEDEDLRGFSCLVFYVLERKSYNILFQVFMEMKIYRVFHTLVFCVWERKSYSILLCDYVFMYL